MKKVRPVLPVTALVTKFLHQKQIPFATPASALLGLLEQGYGSYA
jgi:hypothetical protein